MTKNILVIDDDKDTLALFEDIFVDVGYAVTGFTEINDIKEVVEKFSPDLVIVDYLLKGLNGGEMCAEIKRNENLKHIPVILISGHSSAMLAPGTYNCDEFIEKPFDLDYIIQRVGHHLKNSKRRQRNTAYIKVEFRKGL